jgi:hypothetical protein
VTPLAAGILEPRRLRGLALDAATLLLVVLCVPLAILIVGAPFALAARLLLELFARL